MAGGGHGTKAVIAALLANAGIAVGKFVGFVITGSVETDVRASVPASCTSSPMW